MLMSLAQRVNQTQLQEKDPDAENLLGRELGANPDTLYILAQTVLVQDIALQQAKAQVTQLQQQAQQLQQQAKPQPAHATSFLGGLFGRHDDPPAQQAPPPPQAQPMQAQPGQAPPYQPVPSYQPPQYQQTAQPQYYPPPQPQYVGAPVGQPSFLRGAMQTAAGVAAGALAFEGVESILHGFGHPGYGGGFGGGMAGMGMGPGLGMGGGFERPVEETVVNNYYGDSGPGEHGGEQHLRESADQQGGYQMSDANNTTQGSDAGQGGYQLSDANYTTQGNDDASQGGYDQSMADDSSAYDNSADDVQIDDGGGGFDDGGGSDNS
jgi:hypothetical protein